MNKSGPMIGVYYIWSEILNYYGLIINMEQATSIVYSVQTYKLSL